MIEEKFVRKVEKLKEELRNTNFFERKLYECILKNLKYLDLRYTTINAVANELACGIFKDESVTNAVQVLFMLEKSDEYYKALKYFMERIYDNYYDDGDEEDALRYKILDWVTGEETIAESALYYGTILKVNEMLKKYNTFNDINDFRRSPITEEIISDLRIRITEKIKELSNGN